MAPQKERKKKEQQTIKCLHLRLGKEKAATWTGSSSLVNKWGTFPLSLCKQQSSKNAE
jgi:hypothetical protein